MRAALNALARLIGFALAASLWAAIAAAFALSLALPLAFVCWAVALTGYQCPLW